MSRLRPGKTIQVIDNRWYETKKYELEECYGCGFRHKIHTKIKNGKVYQKWNSLKKEKK